MKVSIWEGVRYLIMTCSMGIWPQPDLNPNPDWNIETHKACTWLWLATMHVRQYIIPISLISHPYRISRIVCTDQCTQTAYSYLLSDHHWHWSHQWVSVYWDIPVYQIHGRHSYHVTHACIPYAKHINLFTTCFSWLSQECMSGTWVYSKPQYMFQSCEYHSTSTSTWTPSVPMG